jgi:hypothetical protein
MKDVFYVNVPPLPIIPSYNAANGREIDATSGFPVPVQSEIWAPAGVDENDGVIYGIRDSRFPHRIKQVPPDTLGVDWKIFSTEE